MNSSPGQPGTFTLKVLRANPGQHEKRRFQQFQIREESGMTVLDALLYAKEQLDHSIAIRFSCRMASCGSCGMKINGLPKLACYTQVKELRGSVVTVEPLDNYPLVRDLVTDFHGFFSAHKSVKPYLIRKNLVEQDTFESEYSQNQDQVDDFLQFSGCIKCGLCNAACPTLSTDPLFTGPQALGQAYRYTADSRDEGGIERLEVVDEKHGIWRCHFAGACSYVCPKGVDPALAIQKLRRLEISRNPLKRAGAPLMPRRGVPNM